MAVRTKGKALTATATPGGLAFLVKARATGREDRDGAPARDGPICLERLNPEPTSRIVLARVNSISALRQH